MRGSPWWALGIILMKRTRLTHQSTTLSESGRTHMHMDSPPMHAHEHTLTKGKDSMTIGTCCRFHQCQVGEQPSPKELPWSGNAAVWPAHEYRCSRYRHASKWWGCWHGNDTPFVSDHLLWALSSWVKKQQNVFVTPPSAAFCGHILMWLHVH